MSKGLLLQEIVTLAALDRRSARYVLDKAKRIDIRPAAGRGHGRRMDLREAVRLAVCVQFVRHGVSLDAAQNATAWCENEWARQADGDSSQLPFEGARGTIWAVELMNARHVFLVREGSRRLQERAGDTSCYDLIANDLVSPPRWDYHLPILRWSLSAVVDALSGRSPHFSK